MFIIQIFNCICVVYFIYSKYLGRDEMGIQRYNGRGKTVLGKWGNGRRYLGRDELGIQRYNGRGETGLGKWGNGNIHFNFFVDISFLLRRLV